jgi:hypothetical protein
MPPYLLADAAPFSSNPNQKTTTMNTTYHYSPRPLRESSPRKSASQIQQEIDLMRAMYAERRSLNHRRHEAMVGWSLVIIAIGVPIVAAVAILI